jgi:hypothetical protein
MQVRLHPSSSSFSTKFLETNTEGRTTVSSSFLGSLRPRSRFSYRYPAQAAVPLQLPPESQRVVASVTANFDWTWIPTLQRPIGTSIELQLEHCS